MESRSSHGERCVRDSSTISDENLGSSQPRLSQSSSSMCTVFHYTKGKKDGGSVFLAVEWVRLIENQLNVHNN